MDQKDKQPDKEKNGEARIHAPELNPDDQTIKDQAEPDMETLRMWDKEERTVADEVRAQEWLNEMRGPNTPLPDLDLLYYSEPEKDDPFEDIDPD